MEYTQCTGESLSVFNRKYRVCMRPCRAILLLVAKNGARIKEECQLESGTVKPVLATTSLKRAPVNYGR